MALSNETLKKLQKTEGRIFDIERYATEDGPGIRTVVFLKGCPLRCRWCANPESQFYSKEIMYYASRCTGCGKCWENCPAGAIIRSDAFGLVTDAKTCTACGLCVKNCFYNARKISGEDMSAGGVMQKVLKDKAYYEKSGGGITLSGGEPLMQADFTSALLQLSKENALHTAVETCGIPSAALEKVIALIDYLMIDLKHTDMELCLQQTGSQYTEALEGIRLAAQKHQNMVIRIPVISGFNHTEKDMQKIFSWIKTIDKNLLRVELLPYHRLGREKYTCLGRDYSLSDLEQLTPEDLLPYTDLGEKMGLNVFIGAR